MCDSDCSYRSYLLFLKTLVGFALYIADLVTDVLQAAEYHRNGDIAWFRMTLGFALGAQLIENLVLAYLDDSCKQCLGECKCLRWVFMPLLGVPIKYLQVLYSFCEDDPEDIWNARKTERRATRKPVPRLVNHLLPLARLIGTLLESLPELCLQIYIVLQQSQLESSVKVKIQPLKVITMVMSFLASLYSIIEWEAHFPKVVVWFGGILILFLWKIIDLSVRICAVCLFASVHTYWVFVAVGLHWLVMAVVENVFYWCSREEVYAWRNAKADVISNSNCCVQFMFNTFVVAPVDVLTWVTFGSRLRGKVQPIVNNVLMSVTNILIASLITWYYEVNVHILILNENLPWYAPFSMALPFGGSFVSAILHFWYWMCIPIEDSNEYKRVNSFEMT